MRGKGSWKGVGGPGGGGGGREEEGKRVACMPYVYPHSNASSVILLLLFPKEFIT